MTCTRVIIINKGRIEALDTPENLQARLSIGGEIILEVRVSDVAASMAKLRAIEGLTRVTHQKIEEWTRFTIESDNDLRERLHDLAVQEKWPVRELSRGRASLEQVFAEITHREES